MSARNVGIGTLFLAGIAFGALSLAIARREPAFAFAGELPTRAAAELIAGWSLLAVGLVAWRGDGAATSARCSSAPPSAGSCSSGTTLASTPRSGLRSV